MTVNVKFIKPLNGVRASTIHGALFSINARVERHVDNDVWDSIYRNVWRPVGDFYLRSMRDSLDDGFK